MSKIFKFQVLDRNDLDRDFHSVEEKWSVYVDNFVKQEGDESILDQRQSLYLNRNLARKSAEPFVLEYNLECKICVNTYKMFFVENSEDYLHRSRSRQLNAGAVKTTSSATNLTQIMALRGKILKAKQEAFINKSSSSK